MLVNTWYIVPYGHELEYQSSAAVLHLHHKIFMVEL